MYFKKVKVFLHAVLFFSMLSTVYSQSTQYQLGLGLGYTSYQGDLNDGTLENNLTVVKPIFNLYFGYQPIEFLELKLNAFYGGLEASDAISKKASKYKRNLSASTQILGGEFRLEGNILPLDFYTDRIFAPFLFGTVGALHFDPYTTYHGTKVYLQELGTEGQGLEGFDDPYSKWTLMFSTGAGIKFKLGEYIVLSGEGAYIWSFTDYLDDVGAASNAPYAIMLEQKGDLAADLSNLRDNYLGIAPEQYNESMGRGNPNSNDGYVILRASLGIYLDAFRMPRKKARCF